MARRRTKCPAEQLNNHTGNSLRRNSISPCPPFHPLPHLPRVFYSLALTSRSEARRGQQLISKGIHGKGTVQEEITDAISRMLPAKFQVPSFLPFPSNFSSHFPLFSLLFIGMLYKQQPIR